MKRDRNYSITKNDQFLITHSEGEKCGREECTDRDSAAICSDGQRHIQNKPRLSFYYVELDYNR